MNKSDEGWRGDMRSKSRQEGGEETDRQGEKENEGGSGAKDGKKRGPSSASGAGTRGSLQRMEDKHKEPGLEHPGHRREVR